MKKFQIFSNFLNETNFIFINLKLKTKMAKDAESLKIKSDDIDGCLAADFDGSLSGLGVEIVSNTYNMRLFSTFFSYSTFFMVQMWNFLKIIICFEF